MGIKKSFCLFFILLIASCSNEGIMEKMEQIKTVGNHDPEKALAMLDSLDIDIRNENDYARHKYDLLRIRLNDKAYNLPISDIMIKQLIPYFEENGSIPEKQEVYYYAGSTYRDLQDTPRALEYFFKSLDIALDHEECDLIMLRNTYSNLHYLFYMVQDYSNAAKMGVKELESCRQAGTDVVLPFNHIGASYAALDSVPQAVEALDSAFAHIVKSGDIHSYQENLVYVLLTYSYLKELQRAKDCSLLIEDNPLEEYNANSCMAFACYYEELEKFDSAAIYFEKMLEDSTDIPHVYEAAKHLFKIYKEAGDKVKAAECAEIYMKMSSEIDFGKRQELAATVNNQYQYHLDQKKEQELKDEKERYKTMLIVVCLAALLLASLGVIYYIWKRNRHLKEIVELLEENKAREQQLAEREEQNKAIIKLMHKTELEGTAEEVVEAVRQASTGKKEMTAAEWKQLYCAVDELYPSFKDRLVKELGNYSEQQQQVCYLMRIGLSNPQIQNMTNLSRPTVWRWVKKYDWVLEAEGKSK